MCTVTFLPLSNDDFVLTSSRDVGFKREKSDTPRNYEENGVTISDYAVGMLPIDQSEGAAASRIRVYEVAGELPAAAVAYESGRLVGSHSERWDIISQNFPGASGSQIKYGYYEHYRAMANMVPCPPLSRFSI